MQHARNGHRSVIGSKLKLLHGLKDNESHSFCPSCASTKRPIGKYGKKKDARKRSKVPYAVIHLDLMQASVDSKNVKGDGGGYRFALVIVDDHTNMSHVFGLVHKNEAIKKIRCFHQNGGVAKKFEGYRGTL